MLAISTFLSALKSILSNEFGRTVLIALACFIAGDVRGSYSVRHQHEILSLKSQISARDASLKESIALSKSMAEDNERLEHVRSEMNARIRELSNGKQDNGCRLSSDDVRKLRAIARK